VIGPRHAVTVDAVIELAVELAADSLPSSLRCVEGTHVSWGLQSGDK
jgi:hypothetical protein